MPECASTSRIKLYCQTLSRQFWHFHARKILYCAAISSLLSPLLPIHSREADAFGELSPLRHIFTSQSAPLLLLSSHSRQQTGPLVKI